MEEARGLDRRQQRLQARIGELALQRLEEKGVLVLLGGDVPAIKTAKDAIFHGSVSVSVYCATARHAASDSPTRALTRVHVTGEVTTHSTRMHRYLLSERGKETVAGACWRAEAWLTDQILARGSVDDITQQTVEHWLCIEAHVYALEEQLPSCTGSC